MAHRRVGRGIDQELTRDPWRALVARQEADDRPEVAAGAVAADREPARIDAERSAVVGDPSRRGEAIIDRRGEFVFRAHAVIDRDNSAFRAVREMAAHRLVALDIANDPAAAMKEHEHGQDAGRHGTVEPRRDRPAGSRDRDVARLGDRHRVGRERLAPGHEQLARGDGSDRLERGAVRLLDHLEQDLDVVIERH